MKHSYNDDDHNDKLCHSQGFPGGPDGKESTAMPIKQLLIFIFLQSLETTIPLYFSVNLITLDTTQEHTVFVFSVTGLFQ